jgi:hypothetical protein
MRKLLPWSIVGVLLCVSLGSADLVTPRKLAPPEPVHGMAVRSTIEKFKANEPALVTVTGFQSETFQGETCLALYLFDAHGNCVAKDDRTSAQSSDKLAVVWVPPDANSCFVEVRNAGITMNAYLLAIR